MLERELAAAEADREGFVQQMSQEDYEEVRACRAAPCVALRLVLRDALLHYAVLCGVLEEPLSWGMTAARCSAPTVNHGINVANPRPSVLQQVVSSWRGKLDRAVAGEQKWGLFRAFKPQVCAGGTAALPSFNHPCSSAAALQACAAGLCTWHGRRARLASYPTLTRGWGSCP